MNKANSNKKYFKINPKGDIALFIDNAIDDEEIIENIITSAKNPKFNGIFFCKDINIETIIMILKKKINKDYINKIFFDKINNKDVLYNLNLFYPLFKEYNNLNTINLFNNHLNYDDFYKITQPLYNVDAISNNRNVVSNNRNAISNNRNANKRTEKKLILNFAKNNIIKTAITNTIINYLELNKQIDIKLDDTTELIYIDYKEIPYEIINSDLETSPDIEIYKNKIHNILQSIEISSTNNTNTKTNSNKNTNNKINTKINNKINNKNWEDENDEIIKYLFNNEKIYNNFLTNNIKNGLINYSNFVENYNYYVSNDAFPLTFGGFLIDMHGILNNTIFKLPENINIVFLSSIGYSTTCHNRDIKKHIIPNIIHYYNSPSCYGKDITKAFHTSVIYYGGQYCLDLELSKNPPSIKSSNKTTNTLNNTKNHQDKKMGLFKMELKNKKEYNYKKISDLIPEGEYQGNLSDLIRSIISSKDNLVSSDKTYTILLTSCREFDEDTDKENIKRLIYFERINKITNFVIEKKENSSVELFEDCMSIKTQTTEKLSQKITFGSELPISSILNVRKPENMKISGRKTLFDIKKQFYSDKKIKALEDLLFEKEDLHLDDDLFISNHTYTRYINKCIEGNFKNNEKSIYRCNIQTLKDLYYISQDKEIIIKYLNHLKKYLFELSYNISPILSKYTDFIRTVNSEIYNLKNITFDTKLTDDKTDITSINYFKLFNLKMEYNSDISYIDYLIKLINEIGFSKNLEYKTRFKTQKPPSAVSNKNKNKNKTRKSNNSSSNNI